MWNIKICENVVKYRKISEKTETRKRKNRNKMIKNIKFSEKKNVNYNKNFCRLYKWQILFISSHTNVYIFRILKILFSYKVK